MSIGFVTLEPDSKKLSLQWVTTSSYYSVFICLFWGSQTAFISRSLKCCSPFCALEDICRHIQIAAEHTMKQDLTVFVLESFSTKNNLWKYCSQMQWVSGVGQGNLYCQSLAVMSIILVWEQCYVRPDIEGSCARLGLQTSSFQMYLPYVKKPEKK